MPELTLEGIINTEFMNGFGKYATDNFVFRDALRTTRSFTVFHILMQTDKSGLYYDKNVGGGKYDIVEVDQYGRSATNIAKMAAEFAEAAEEGGAASENIRYYYSLVPDKSIYAGKYMPGFDPELAHGILAEKLDDRMTFIDIAGILTAGNYYRTDLHWNQSTIMSVVDILGIAMDFSERMEKDFTPNIAGDFHGVYTGQLALPLKPDSMVYMTSPAINGAEVRYLNAQTLNWTRGNMYEPQMVRGRDPYDIFLRGVQALITIDNPSAATERELFIFRDSFSSSLAPLLTSAYRKITLIDLRYIMNKFLLSPVDAEGTMLIDFSAIMEADVLFLYSSQILNNSETLLIH